MQVLLVVSIIINILLLSWGVSLYEQKSNLKDEIHKLTKTISKISFPYNTVSPKMFSQFYYYVIKYRELMLFNKEILDAFATYHENHKEPGGSNFEKFLSDLYFDGQFSREWQTIKFPTYKIDDLRELTTEFKLLIEKIYGKQQNTG